MDSNSIQLFKKALHAGTEKVYNIRVMVIGQSGVGKTILIKRLLGQPVDISERRMTEGIDVHKHCCKVSLDTGEWIQQVEDSDQLYILHRLNKVLSGLDQKPDISQEQDGIEIGEVQSSTQLSITNLDKETGIVAVPLDDAKSSESEKKDSMMDILRLLNENADKLGKDVGNYAAVSVWDFAGQYAFYTTHQMFLTSRAVYLLVIDLSQQINDHIQDDKFFLDADGIKLCKVLEPFQIWMNSIHSSVESPNDVIPVILVGTHVDKIPEKSRKQVIDKYFAELRYMLKQNPAIRHLMDNIAIDNTQPDPMLEELKKRIFELSSQQPHWGEEHPTRWIPLEQVFMRLKASGVKVAPRSLIEELNMSGSVKIEPINELELFLKFHHEMGTILYFSIEELREIIVLDPHWMIDALKTLITAGTFVLKYPAITSKFYDFIKTGKLTRELIDVIWAKEKNPEFHYNKDHILRLMEQLNIIARPRVFSKEGKEIKEESFYLAPCMLQQETPEEIISPIPNRQIESSPVLCYVFTGNFLPSPIFHRLVAACVARWPIAKKMKEHKEENLIFCGCCVFQLEEEYKLTLLFKEHVIFLRVTRMGIKDKTPSSKLCIEVREFITTNLLKIIGCLGKGLKFEYFIQCPEYNGVSINSLIPVSRLETNAEVHCEFHDNMIESCKVLDSWFKDQVKNIDGQDKDDVDVPITQENINHAHLCNALITVCSNALREILLTNVPTPHKDIYMAILANKVKLKKLNKDQVQLVFPDLQGLSTGKVEEFDISLLYTIIRNISAVPAPSNGWGNPPADNPRDTTLGASVERIHLYRNDISGHSVDGKISQQEFEDYWAKIDEVLREIENVIGNHGYLEDLEKLKNQAITIDEAHELQKKFQEYKRQTEGNPLEAVRPVDVLLAIISDKSIETILQMITSLQESEIHDIEIRIASTYLQHIHKESLTQSERRKEDIFKALFDSCKSDLLDTLKTGEHSDDILRSALQYILPINDPSAKAAILNVAGANLKSKLSNPDCDVWGGLDVRIDSKCSVSLVCLHRGNLNTQPDSHLGLPVLYREYDRIEREPFEASFSDEYHTLISPEDLRRANLLINKHGEELFKKHTNLVAISPSSVLSSKSRGLKIEPSIVLYCRMKGVIPIGENLFPKTLELEGIILSTDIREGLFTFVMHEQAQQKSFRPIDRNNKLRMGCSIGRENSNSSGTLGPFVRLGSDVGFITCAHVIGFDKRTVFNQTVVQPADGDSDDSERACGTVLDVHFDPDKPVDAALIKVNNRDVAPTDFTWFNTEEIRNAGFDPTKPPSFLGGSVRMDTGFSDAQGKRVIKCGKKTGLTKGSLALNGIMIRIDDCRFVFPAGITWNEFSAVVMKNQYLVENNRYPFCSCGDSGAGVYLVENEQNNLCLIGILIGLLNDYTIVTPIGPVLESLQLKPEDVIADELVQKTTEIPKSSSSYCTLQ